MITTKPNKVTQRSSDINTDVVRKMTGEYLRTEIYDSTMRGADETVVSTIEVDPVIEQNSFMLSSGLRVDPPVPPSASGGVRDISRILESDRGMRSERGLCTVCGFVVKLEGHESRCRHPSALSDSTKDLAWVGQAMWELFVRVSVVELKLDKTVAGDLLLSSTAAKAFPEVIKYVSMAKIPEHDASVHTKAVYVQAATAVSSTARMLLLKCVADAFLTRAKYLWKPVMHVALERQIQYPVQPSFDGYCYLSMFPKSLWSHVTSQLGAYPEWREVFSRLKRGYVVRVWIVIESGFCHVLPFFVPGATEYFGDPVDMTLDPRCMVGGEKTVDLIASLKQCTIHKQWKQSSAVVHLLSSLAGDVLTVQCKERVLAVSKDTWSKILWLTTVPPNSIEYIEDFVRKLTNSLDVIRPFFLMDKIVVGTSGLVGLFERSGNSFEVFPDVTYSSLEDFEFDDFFEF